jgi:hypothetical protein
MIVPLSEIIATLESGTSVNGDDTPAKGNQRGVLKALDCPQVTLTK